MLLSKLWRKIERGEPLYTSEEKHFTEELNRGIDDLIIALNMQK